MDYYRINSLLYNNLSKVVEETIIVSSKENIVEKPRTYPRLKESDFIISDDLTNITRSVLSAHNINDYIVSGIRIERLMLDSNVLLIDIILKDMEEIRVVSVQSFKED